jgi:hypothetical protein
MLGLLDRLWRIKAVVRRVKEVKIRLCKMLFLSKLHLNHNLFQKMTVILGLLK